MHEGVTRRVSLLLQQASSQLTAECHRLGAWGVLAEGTGATLLKPRTSTPLSKDEIVGNDMSIRAEDAVSMDPKTGLLMARKGTQMLLADGSVKDVPSDHCIHPQTGRVLPIAGNVAFDPVTSRLLMVVDSATGEAARSEDPYIPYLPFPRTRSGDLTKTQLKPLPSKGDLRYGAPTSDPATGLHVPIVAITLHPETGAILPVGGVHTDPVTGLPVPIEPGSVMLDPDTGVPVPILGVAIDPETGVVVPVGGVRAGERGGIPAPLVPGDSVLDAPSGKMTRLHGGCLRHGQVLPSGGGYQALLDAAVLACEARLLDCARMYKEAVHQAGLDPGSRRGLHVEEADLETAVKELSKARDRMKAQLMRTQQDMSRRLDRAAILASTGGSPGMYEFSKTGQLLPILVGTSMADPGGTGLEVPILGAEKDPVSGKVVPLGGTMEDPEGAGLVPIMIGRRALDPVTGDVSCVVGVRMSPETRLAIPVTLATAQHRKRKAPPGALAQVEEELAGRRAYWRRQRQREADLTMKEHRLLLKLLYHLEDVTSQQLEGWLEELDSLTGQVSEGGQREDQRRGGAVQELAAVLPAELLVTLTGGDQAESERAQGHVAAHSKLTDAVRRFYGKLQVEEKRFQDRAGEVEAAVNPDAFQTAKQRYRQAMARLQGELRDHLTARMTSLDHAHARLEYARQRCLLCLLEARALLAGTGLIAGDYDVRLCGVYGDADLVESSDSQLAPLLRQLIALLEHGGPFQLSPELLRLLQSAQNSTNVTNINVTGQAQNRGQAGQAGQADKDAEAKKRQGTKEKITLVTRSAGGTSTAGTGIDDDSDQVMGEAGRQRKAGKDTDTTDKERFLFERQAYEAARLESELRGQEIQDFNDLLEDTQRKKGEMLDQVSDDLQAKLDQAKDEKERERLMLKYAEEVSKLDEALDKQKVEQAAKLREQLRERRRRAKKDLHSKHLTEAQSQGLPPDVVPPIPIPSNQQIDQELLALQAEQEHLQAELARADQSQTEDQADQVDQELQRDVDQMDLTPEQRSKLLAQVSSMGSNFGTVARNLARTLKGVRAHKRQPGPEELAGLGEEERRKLTEARDLLGQADRNHENNALLRALRRHQTRQHRQALEKALAEMAGGQDEEERRRLLEQLEAGVERWQARQRDQREAQNDKLHAQLAARKRMREQLSRDDAVSRELDTITTTMATRGDLESAEVIVGIGRQLQEGQEQRRLQEEQLAQQEALLEEQRRREREAARKLQAEELGQLRQADNTARLQTQMALDAHQAKFEREVALRGDKLSEEEYRRLLAQHEAERAAIQQNLDRERSRQKQRLADKLAERRKSRMSALKAEHEAVVEEKLAEQQQQRDDLQHDLARKMEDSTLAEKVKGKEGRRAESLIYNVLRQRHMKEAVHLEEQLGTQKQAALHRAQAQTEETRQAERDTLNSAFEQELLELLGNAGSLSPEELAQKKHELKQQQQKQRADFDRLTEEKVAAAERSAGRGLEVEQTHARLGLRERQLGELAAAMTKFSPAQELALQYQQDAKRAKEQATRYRQDVLDRLHKEQERRKAEEKQREEERKRKMVEQMKQLQKELEAEHEREAARRKEREAERERVRQRQLEERQKHERAHIEHLAVDQDEKTRLLKEHDKNIKQLQQNLQQDKQRSASALQAKLEARRRGRQEAAVAGLQKRSLLEADDQARTDLQQQLQEEQLLNSRIPQGQGRPGQGQAPSPGQGQVAGQGPLPEFEGVEPSGSTEQDWVNLLMASPLFRQINDLERLVAKAGDGAPGSGPSRIAGADYSQAFVDVRDAQWVCKGELIPADIQQVSPQQFVVYRFGVFVVRLLQEALELPPVSLLLAANLPPSTYSNNPFRHSVLYRHAQNVLFVRKERLDSVGDFVIVVLHSLAHVKAGDMTDDSNPLFLRYFYKALKVVCQDLFFSRAQHSSVARRLTGDHGNAREALQTVLQSARTPEERADVVADLIDTRVQRPLAVDRADKGLNQRLQGYQSVASNARLRQVLASNGGFLTSGDFVQSRMAELKGKGSPTASPQRSPSRRPAALLSVATPHDVRDRQLLDIQAEIDNLDLELSKTLATELELKEGLARLNEVEDAERVASLRQQLTAILDKKADLLPRIAALQTDAAQKEKALKGRKK